MKLIHTYTKKIRIPSISFRVLSDTTGINKILSIINRLQSLPSASSLDIRELSLTTNISNWIQILLDVSLGKDNQYTEMTNLLNDFTDNMKSRMREDSKYAIGLLFEDNLLLCHSSYGEETITPNWQIFPRMLDSDNVLRYVLFSEQNGSIKVKFWERESTDSFISWLGLTRKQAYQFGGKYRILSEIEGISLELQLTDFEMGNYITTHPELKNGEINLSNPIYKLGVKEIRVGSKRYELPSDFFQNYEAEKFGVPKFVKDYENIMANYLPLLIRHIDEENQVTCINSESKSIVVSKNTKYFDIIFANGDVGNIFLLESYQKTLIRKLVNNEPLLIFHPGLEFKAQPYTYKNLKIYNAIVINDFSQKLIDYYQDLALQDQFLDLILKYIVLKSLFEDNKLSPMGYLFEVLVNGVLENIIISGSLTKLEDDILEYKSKDIFTSDHDIINYLSEDIRVKFKNNDIKVYLVGIEDHGLLQPISAKRVNSDRLAKIKKGIEDKMPDIRLWIFAIEKFEKVILIICAQKNFNFITHSD